jgi:hypothetical protein
MYCASTHDDLEVGCVWTRIGVFEIIVILSGREEHLVV